jgi:hypothetical protein
MSQLRKCRGLPIARFRLHVIHVDAINNLRPWKWESVSVVYVLDTNIHILTQFSHVRRPLQSALLLLCLPLFSFTWPLLPLFVTLWELTPQDLSLISRTRVFPVNGKRELGPRGPSYLFFALDFYMFLRMKEFLPSFVLLLSLLVI